MPQLNRDLLREVFYEIVKQQDGFNQNIDNFMMAGKESFQLVLDHCKKVDDVIIFGEGVVVQLPGIEYSQTASQKEDKEKFCYEKPIIGTRISTTIKLFKPISLALVSTLESLDIRGYCRATTRMMKSINREMKEIYVSCENLKAICQACCNIPNVHDGVTVKVCEKERFFNEMKYFTFPCQKLTIIDAGFNEFCKGKVVNSYLRKNIRNLTIQGYLVETQTSYEELDKFAEFLSKCFPNLETLNTNYLCLFPSESWTWNNSSIMARRFQNLPSGINGCICFTLVNYSNEINPLEFPGVQKNDDEYYKNFSITDTLNFKLATSTQPATITGDASTAVDIRAVIAGRKYLFHINVISPQPLVQQTKKVKYDKKFSSKPAPVFKNQRTFKPIRNRFSR